MFASVSDGSMCHTRLNSHGCCVPSYHMCVVKGLPVSTDVSYTNLLLCPGGSGPGCGTRSPPGVAHVFPPSSERCSTWPNHPLVCDAKIRFGSAGEPLR